MAKRDGRPSVAEALEGHVTLDIECFDRMVFTAYVPLLQSGGGVVTFLRDHRGNPIPSPALFGPIGEAFRAAVRRFAEEHEVPLIPFRSRQDKLATVRPHLDAAAAAEREGVVAIGVAQERRSVWMGSVDHRGPTGIPHYDFHRTELVQRPRARQAPADRSRHRLRAAAQRLPELRRPRGPAADLRRARPRGGALALPSLDGRDPPAALRR